MHHTTQVPRVVSDQRLKFFVKEGESTQVRPVPVDESLRPLSSKNGDKITIYICILCDLRLLTKNDMLRHIEKDHRICYFACPYCNHENSSHDQATAHLQTHGENHPQMPLGYVPQSQKSGSAESRDKRRSSKNNPRSLDRRSNGKCPEKDQTCDVEVVTLSSDESDSEEKRKLEKNAASPTTVGSRVRSMSQTAAARRATNPPIQYERSVNDSRNQHDRSVDDSSNQHQISVSDSSNQHQGTVKNPSNQRKRNRKNPSSQHPKSVTDSRSQHRSVVNSNNQHPRSVESSSNQPHRTVVYSSNQLHMSVTESSSQQQRSVTDSSNQHHRSVTDFSSQHHRSVTSLSSQHHMSVMGSSNQHHSSVTDFSSQHHRSVTDFSNQHNRSVMGSSNQHRRSVTDFSNQHNRSVMGSSNQHRRSVTDSSSQQRRSVKKSNNQQCRSVKKSNNQHPRSVKSSSNQRQRSVIDFINQHHRSVMEASKHLRMDSLSSNPGEEEIMILEDGYGRNPTVSPDQDVIPINMNGIFESAESAVDEIGLFADTELTRFIMLSSNPRSNRKPSSNMTRCSFGNRSPEEIGSPSHDSSEVNFSWILNGSDEQYYIALKQEKDLVSQWMRNQVIF